MENRGIAYLVVAALALAPMTVAFAQGGGGTGGASSSGMNGGSAAGNAMQSQQTQSSGQTPTQGQANGVTTGSSVSVDGDKPGTAANGKPIGSPGSGIGSPEEPWDAKKLK
jgi:hypothetical protein